MVYKHHYESGAKRIFSLYTNLKITVCIVMIHKISEVKPTLEAFV